MDVPFPEPPPPPEPPPQDHLPVVPQPPRWAGLPRFRTGLAWLAIAVFTGFMLLMQGIRTDAATDEAAGPDLGDAMQLFQARYVVGWNSVAGSMSGGQGGAQMIAQLDAMPSGTVEQRLQICVVASELGGREAAADRLRTIDRLVETEGHELTADEATARAVFERLYGDREEETPTSLADRVESLPAEDRALLEQRYGWYGRLALLPAGTADSAAREEILSSAERGAKIVVGVAGLGCVGVLVGFAAAVLFLILAAGQTIVMKLPDSAAPHGVYAETFAIWFVLFVGLPLILALVLPASLGMASSLVVFFGSLVALKWPGRRGVEWEQVKADIGLHRGQGVIVEAFAGIATYVSSIPLIAIGLLGSLVTAAGASLFADQPEGLAPSGAPGGHPVVVELANGSVGTQLLVFMLAVVAAPIVEEIAFRGLLFRHLRGLSERHGRMLSFVFAAPLTSLFFAAIHPQGLIGIPVLACVAMGLSMAREWRDSLIAPMVFHGVSNGLVLSLALAIFSE